MIKSRSFRRYNTQPSTLQIAQLRKEDKSKSACTDANEAIYAATRTRARSKSIDDRNRRGTMGRKTPPPPPRPRPKKYSMNDAMDEHKDDDDAMNGHQKRSQTIDLKQFIQPNEMK